jgi:hypothetical protein
MIVKLVFRDKEKPPYMTRATFNKAPKTIVHDNAVFQNCNVIFVNNNSHNRIYQYTEIPSVLIKEIALHTALPIKLKPVSVCQQ